MSACNLDNRGIHNYVMDPSTKLICAAWAINKEPAQLWIPGQPLPKDFTNHIRRGRRVAAHNAVTERLLTNFVGRRLYGMPFMSIEQMMCTMVRCGHTALPLSLEMAAKVLNLPVQKDMEGAKALRIIMKPITVDNITGVVTFATPQSHPKEFAAVYKYCKTDLDTMRAVTRHTRPLSKFERKVYVIDQRINDRGIELDMVNVRVMKRLAKKENIRLNSEMQAICGLNHTQTDKLKKWINERGVKCATLKKNALITMLAGPGLPADVRRALEIRQEAAKSSVAKLGAMILRAGPDNRARGCLQMGGAVSTFRWGGRAVQTQNLPRPILTPYMINSILEWVKTRKPEDDMETLETIRMIWGRPMSVFSDCLRGLLIPSKGNVLIGPDLVSIESLVSAWLVGDDAKVKFMAGGGKVYEEIARMILGLAPFRGWTMTEGVPVTKAQRQKGKVAELAFGYEGGWRINGAVGTFCEQNNIPYPGEQEARRWQQLWRQNHPHHVRYWKDISRAAVQAVLRPGQQFSLGPEDRRVTFGVEGNFLLCFLPSDSVLCYPFPRVSQPNPRFPPGVTYMKSKGKQWYRNSYYGGHGLENVTQRVARDLLAWGMVNLEAALFKIVTHSHDEAVVDTKRRNAEAKIVRIFNQRPDWAATLPYTSSAFTAMRYQK
jgi:DNA polymerase bacteriophage-type